MARAQLKRTYYERSPSSAWNAFVEFISDSGEHMTPLHRNAGEVFLYESEVQNGGHLQYFENHGRERAQQAMQALGRLGMPCHQKILERALDVWDSAERKRIKTVEEYSEIALEGEFDQFDSEFQACSPDIQEQLERILATHFDEFIELI